MKKLKKVYVVIGTSFLGNSFIMGCFANETDALKLANQNTMRIVRPILVEYKKRKEIKQ